MYINIFRYFYISINHLNCVHGNQRSAEAREEDTTEVAYAPVITSFGACPSHTLQTFTAYGRARVSNPHLKLLMCKRRAS